jgi:hypothetical protein
MVQWTCAARRLEDQLRLSYLLGPQHRADSEMPQAGDKHYPLGVGKRSPVSRFTQGQ